MKNLLLLIVYIGLTLFANAQDPNGNKINISVLPNVQIHNLQWSIAGNINGTKPNIFSELKWKNIVTPAITTQLEFTITKRLYLAARYNFGFTINGKANDTDYQGDNRTDVAFRADVDSNNGSTQSLKGSMGYFIITSQVYQLRISGGYFNENQLLTLEDDTYLNSSYKTKWSGPSVEISQRLKVYDNIFLALNGLYTQANYRAKANWNLIETVQHPVSFRHRARGFGIEGAAEVELKFSSLINASIGMSRCYWSTGNGIDELYHTSGMVQTTRLNDVTRSGLTLYFGIEVSW